MQVTAGDHVTEGANTGGEAGRVRLAWSGDPARRSDLTSATVETEVLARGLDLVGDREGLADSAFVQLRPVAVEITRYDPTAAYWESAVVTRTGRIGALAGAHVDASALRLAIGTPPRVTDGGVEVEVELEVGADGSLRAGGHVVRPADEPLPEPPRPTAGNVLPTRVVLPRSVPAGIAIRIDGPNLLIPKATALRFSGRHVSLTTLYELDGTWYMSGIADGRPSIVIVGTVGAY